MRQKLKMLLKAVVVLIMVVWIFSKIPFSKTINQEISARIYENGRITGETKVIIDGARSHYLFTENEWFHGKFYITAYEKSGRQDMTASIRWKNEDTIQHLTYFQNAGFPSMDIINTLIMNDTMTQFALMFTDGTVIATSDEIYQIDIKHISYDRDTGVTSIDDVGRIPKIETP